MTPKMEIEPFHSQATKCQFKVTGWAQGMYLSVAWYFGAGTLKPGLSLD